MHGIESLFFQRTHNGTIERAADCLLALPRLFMGRQIRMVPKNEAMILGRKLGLDGTRKTYVEEKEALKNSSTPTSRLMELMGNMDALSIGLWICGGAVILIVASVAAVILGTVGLAIVSVSTAAGMGLKKLSIEMNHESKACHVAIKQFLILEDIYKQEKKIASKLKSIAKKILKLNTKIDLHHLKLNGFSSKTHAQPNRLLSYIWKAGVWDEKRRIRQKEEKRNRLLALDRSLQTQFDTLALQEPDARESLFNSVRNAYQLSANISVDASELPTSLHLALRTQSIGVARKLITDQKCDLNARDKNGSTPLHEAVKIGHQEMIHLLIQKGVDVNLRDRTGKTPLELAIEKQNSFSVESLLKKEGIAVVDKSGRSLLFRSITLGHQGIVERLLDHAKNLEVRNEEEMTPLLFSVGQGKTAIARLLMQHGADIHTTTPRENNSLLHIAAGSRSEQTLLLICEHLREKKLWDVEIKNQDGRTPLHLAVRTGDIGMIKRLVSLGANPAAVDRFGKKPGDYKPNSRHFSPELLKNIMT